MSFSAKAAELRASAPFDISKLSNSANINAHARVLLDGDDRTWQQLDPLIEAQRREVSELLQGGYRDGYYWVRLNISNESIVPKSARLIIANRLTSHLEYFIPLADPNPSFTLKRLQLNVPTLELTLGPGQNLRLLLKLKFGLQDTVNFLMEPLPAAANDSKTRAINIQEVVFGMILSMILFNICLFLITHQIIFLLHALASSAVFCVVILMSGVAYDYFAVDHWNRLLPVAGCLAVAGNSAFGQIFLNTRKNSPFVHRYFTIGVVVGVIGALILLLGGTRKIIYITDLNLVAMVGMCIATGFMFPPSRFRAMRFYLIGWLGLAVCSLIWLATEYALVQRSMITQNAMTVGLAFELIVVSLGLADQINNLKNSLTEYNKNLEQTVDEKTRDIRSIMDNIPIGVFMISRENRIHKDHSQHLKDILPDNDFEKRYATDIFFERFELSSNEKSQAVSTIIASLGEDLVNFDFNVHTLPLELFDSDNRIWDVTWNAIPGRDGYVEKILVTMREITAIRQLVESNKAQQVELELIGEILAVPSPRFLQFVRSTRQLLEENAELLSQLREDNLGDVLKNLFINAHTVKGVARSLYFKKMTQMLHEMEQSYVEVQKNPRQPWDVLRMKAELAAVQKQLDQYETIARVKLDRKTEQSRSIEFSIEEAELAYSILGRIIIHEKSLTADSRFGLEQIQTILRQQVFCSAREFFEEFSSFLPTLARDLHKEEPILELKVDGFYLKDKAQDILRNIFIHLLRNSMDHGIESGDERLRRQKATKGRITIIMECRDDNVLVTLEDDGRGLNLGRIAKLALEKNMLSTAERQDPRLVAEMIFDAGLSTALQVTEISGRGVGMNAVRSLAQNQGGDVLLQLGHENPGESGYWRFQFHVLLPVRFFEVYERSDQQSVA